MKVRITMLAGNWLEFDPPEDFNLMAFVTNVRANGFYFDGANAFIPLHAMASILHFDPEKLEASPIVMGMTKQ